MSMSRCNITQGTNFKKLTHVEKLTEEVVNIREALGKKQGRRYAYEDVRMLNEQHKKANNTKTAHLVTLLIRKATWRLQLHLLEGHHVLRERACLVGEEAPRLRSEVVNIREVLWKKQGLSNAYG